MNVRPRAAATAMWDGPVTRMLVAVCVWTGCLRLAWRWGAFLPFCSWEPLLVMFWSLCACVAAAGHLSMHILWLDGLIRPLTLPCEVALCLTVQRTN